MVQITVCRWLCPVWGILVSEGFLTGKAFCWQNQQQNQGLCGDTGDYHTMCLLQACFWRGQMTLRLLRATQLQQLIDRGSAWLSSLIFQAEMHAKLAAPFSRAVPGYFASYGLHKHISIWSIHRATCPGSAGHPDPTGCENTAGDTDQR